MERRGASPCFASFAASVKVSIALLLALFVLCSGHGHAAVDEPEVCENRELLDALRIVNSACSEDLCNFSKLAELDSVVDREQFLIALSNPYLRAVHIFFPSNEYELFKAFDWWSIKRGQMSTLRSIDNPERAAVFIIGSASVTGALGDQGDDHNRRLSYSRMRGVLDYLRDELKIPCRDFRVGWLGREVLQLSASDATFLHVNPRDYRSDDYVLNQSVHVFVFPCKEKI